MESRAQSGLKLKYIFTKKRFNRAVGVGSSSHLVLNLHKVGWLARDGQRNPDFSSPTTGLTLQHTFPIMHHAHIFYYSLTVAVLGLRAYIHWHHYDIIYFYFLKLFNQMSVGQKISLHWRIYSFFFLNFYMSPPNKITHGSRYWQRRNHHRALPVLSHCSNVTHRSHNPTT